MKEVLRVRPALTIAPRQLLEPVTIAGRQIPAGVHLAACLWLSMRRDDLWEDAARLQARALAGRRPAERGRLDPVRRRRAPLRGRAVRRDGDARGAARGRRAARDLTGAGRARARPPQRARRDARPRRRGARPAALGAVLRHARLVPVVQHQHVAVGVGEEAMWQTPVSKTSPMKLTPRSSSVARAASTSSTCRARWFLFGGSRRSPSSPG